MSGALELIDLSYAYEGRDVVREVSLDVQAGEIVCLLGPSGCGKTTCLRIAAGLEPLDRGEVRIAGTRVAGGGVHVPPEKRRVGLVLQDYALFPHLTVEDNIGFGLEGVSRAERRRRSRALLAQVGLEEYAKAYPHEISGGEQQRVALVRALAPEPAVMLMDEPFSGLDVTLRAAVREQAIAVLRARQAPTLIVTHDPEEALAVADRIAIMRDGRIVQVDTAETVYLSPNDPFVLQFFGVPNRLSGKVGPQGEVETGFGRIARPGLTPGACVDIYFRGNALQVAADGQGREMLVESARLLGPVQRVVLRPPEGGAPVVMEHARRFAVSAGDRLRVRMAGNEFYVFETEQPIVEKERTS